MEDQYLIKNIIIHTETQSKPNQSSKIEFFFCENVSKKLFWFLLKTVFAKSCILDVWLDVWCASNLRVFMKLLGAFPKDTGRKLNVHKTFRRRRGRLLDVLCTFHLRSVSTELIQSLDSGPAKPGVHFFSKQKKINNNNRNKLKIHNITPWIGQSICYYLNFIWFSPFVYVCKARTFFSCYYYYWIQLFYLYKTW